MTPFEDLIINGPKNIYEIVALTQDREKAILFLLDVIQFKENIITIQETIIKQELGEGWWRMYADHLTQEGPEDYGISTFGKGVISEEINQSDILI